MSKFFASFLAALIGVTAHAAETRDIQICYFSLNSDKEFKTMKKMVESVNKKATRKIVIKEFQVEGSSAEQSFQAMVASNARCDSLVISGHHTGSFGGERANGQLKVDFLEKLSCNPNHKAWFEQLRAVWLQGCRTLGVGAQERIEGNPEFDPQAQTNRVAPLLGIDNLALSVAELNNDFTVTLDDTNPLSTRYLRVFPRASVFGWTKTAPGVVTSSELSVPLHLANIMKLTQGEHIADEVKIINSQNFEKFNPQQAAGMAKALDTVMQNHCSDEKGCLAAWQEHGKMIQNNDLTSYESLVSSPNPIFEEAKRLACRMRDEKDLENAYEAFLTTIKREDLSKLNFNAIVAFLQRSRFDADVYERAKGLLAKSEVMRNLLEDRINNPRIGILAKVDAYALYRDHMGGRSENFENKIKQTAFSSALLANPDQSYDARDMRETVLDSLIRNQIITLSDTSVAELKTIPNFGTAGVVDFLRSRDEDSTVEDFSRKFLVKEIPALLKSNNVRDRATALAALFVNDPSSLLRHEDIYLGMLESSDPYVSSTARNLTYRSSELFPKIKDQERFKRAAISSVRNGAIEDRADALSLVPYLNISEKELRELGAQFVKTIPATLRPHIPEFLAAMEELVETRGGRGIWLSAKVLTTRTKLDDEDISLNDDDLIGLGLSVETFRKDIAASPAVKTYLDKVENVAKKKIKASPDGEGIYAKREMEKVRIARLLISGDLQSYEPDLPMYSGGSSVEGLGLMRRCGFPIKQLQELFLRMEKQPYDMFSTSHSAERSLFVDPTWIPIIKEAQAYHKRAGHQTDIYDRMLKTADANLKFQAL